MLYEPTEEEITLAIDKLSDAFSEKAGFPKTGTSLRLTAKGFCRIVWQKRCTEIPPLGGQPHPKLGDVMDDDWLIEQMLEQHPRFPSLIEFRKVYENYLPTHDGRDSSEMAV
jgi:hypothetical protein